ncbi:MAG: ribosome biogenesis factor YjgA [Burkholderiales bacterium]
MESVSYHSKRPSPRTVPAAPFPDPMARHRETAPETDAPPPSKTRRKHAMHALQDLGEALIAQDPARVAELGLPEPLVDAIAQARGIRAHEGRRRQLQYVGKLMRDVDPAPIEAALARWAAGIPEDRERFAALERWRDELVADDAALDRFLAAHPDAERVALATLVREVRAERARGGPPHRYRALFRKLRTVTAPVAGEAEADAGDA